MSSPNISGQKYMFGTKAETLTSLKDLISYSHIPEFLYFTVKQWRDNPVFILKEARRSFGKDVVIVRSSAYSEDTALSSLAGLHDSVAGIAVDDTAGISQGIEKVIASYKKSEHPDGIENNQVLIQRMVKDISMSGVVFTQDLNTGAPYYVVNYDDETGRTDTITAGAENSNRTLLVHRESVESFRSQRFKALLAAVQEIENVTECDFLDIEFALDKQNTVYLLQVRQITTRPNWNQSITNEIRDAIKYTQEFIKEAFTAKSKLFGQRTIFGRMPDWNPAEMIGTAPRPLALSLYHYLITHYAWRHARKQMGYFEPQGVRLMVSLLGHPYIDVGASFNSFLPAELDSSIKEKLVNAWLERLSEYKELHDKIEFDVAITVLAFDFKQSIQEQIPGALTKDEQEIFRKSLFTLTNNLLSGETAPIRGELDKIALLEQRRIHLMQSCVHPDLTVVSGLLEDCIHLGTIPFSILARHAFIAKSFLRSFVRCGVADESEILAFQRSIKTMASKVVDDFDRLTLGNINPKEFMAQYGHLRPGTYDILSRRYDQRDDLINGKVRKPVRRDTTEEFSFSSKQVKQIDTLLQRFGFTVTAQALLTYISEATAAREYAKFVFTKNISDALEIIAAWGETIGLGREELSYLSIDSILDTMHTSRRKTLKAYLQDKFCQEKKKHEIALVLHFPYLIETPADVAIVPLLLNKPNFITKKTVRGNYAFLDCEQKSPPEIAGHIVLIEGADPGFDWIFSRPIKGLITKFGGANSHMAIRCAEFGLPAAIGCGEQIFDRVLRSREIEINCAEGRIVPIEG